MKNKLFISKDKLYTEMYDFNNYKKVRSEQTWDEVKNLSGHIIQKLAKATKRRSEYGNRAAPK